MSTPDVRWRAHALNELFKRLFTSAPPAMREDDTPFARKIGEWVDLHSRMVGAGMEAIPVIGPWINVYNELRDQVIAQPGTTPPPRARSIVDRILDIPQQAADYAKSAAIGIGGVAVILGGLWLWSRSSRR